MVESTARTSALGACHFLFSLSLHPNLHARMHALPSSAPLSSSPSLT
jgi:hypothetical protein